jgi:hypothetical protein
VYPRHEIRRAKAHFGASLPPEELRISDCRGALGATEIANPKFQTGT